MSGKSNINEKMQQLREFVAWFESDDFSLEQANQKFEAASKLSDDIENELNGVKNTITVLKEKFEA